MGSRVRPQQRHAVFAIALAAALAIGDRVAHAQDVPLFTADFPPEEFAARRGAIYDAIKKDGVAVVQGAASPPGYTRFRQSNDFYYLTGIESPHAYLLLEGDTRRATLFLPHRNEGRERSEGKLLSAEDADLVKKLSGIDAVQPIELLLEDLARRGRSGGARAVYTPFLPAEGSSMSRDLGLREVADLGNDPLDGQAPREGRFVRLLQERFPWLEVKNLTPALDATRLIKSPREIALIKRATRLACLALQEGMRSTTPGLYEHELDGLARFFFYRNGAQGEAYYSLIASGPNAIFPHYNAGKRRLKDGELLLMDFAPDVGYYMSDITRMWPVNGRFSPWQRELYGFYLACYRSILKAIRPGATPAAIMKGALGEMDKALAATRFSKPVYEAGAREFVTRYREAADTRPRLGHWVGMATHDVGSDEGPLRPGMVFTIEPALRVPEEQIYIRLEDLVIVTDSGTDLPSEWLPMDMAAIEKVMAEDGLLQRIPRDAEGATPPGRTDQ
ncbi:MAG: aminopeptidase P N-terminal domain-containing protein [Solirubrobacterales bacterium]|jgi:Xaa-Pro aminopeptidase